jgi:hypothetical protein
MRISNSDLTGAAGAESARAQELQKTGRGASASSRSVGSASSGDRVEFSAGLGQLAQAISIYGASRATQVRNLAALYQGGGYRSDSAATSHAMVSDALSAGVLQ